ncbi:MAG: hypothetical protein KDA74_00075, partial [Planctomycetaceae bacterium]|nr:hypothetical protein [Planctomycetaceae bacterium]
MLKYLIAAIVSGFLILAMFGFIWKTEDEFRQATRDRGWDGEQDVGMELPGDLLQKISIANLLRVYSIPISVLLVGLCLGTAFWLGSSNRSTDAE